MMSSDKLVAVSSFAARLRSQLWQLSTASDLKTATGLRPFPFGTGTASPHYPTHRVGVSHLI